MKTSFFTAAVCLFLAAVSSAQVVFNLNKTNFAPGESIIATWSGRTTPSATDWIGIYPRPIAGDPNGVPDGSPGSTIWKYTSGSQTPGTAVSSGSVTFTNPGLAAGNWTAYFLANDGYTRLGSVQFTVSTAARIAGFTADHAFINDGTPITLSWVVDGGSQGVQSLTISDGSTQTDVMGLNVLDVSPVINTTYTLTLNGTITAQARVFRSAGNTDAFNLGDATHFSGDGDLTVHWDGVAGNPNSWVGIYRIGTQPSNDLSAYWYYLNGTTTAGGMNRPNGSLVFDPAPGEYYAVLFTNSGYTIEQGPIRFSVIDGPLKPFTITSLTEDAGDSRLDWNSLAGVSYDVMTSTDLSNWEPVAENVRAISNATSTFIQRDASDRQRFFMIRKR